jgi:hypothetical protein
MPTWTCKCADCFGVLEARVKELEAQHQAAAVSERAAGACWQCCAEAGCRATDRPGVEVVTEW